MLGHTGSKDKATAWSDLTPSNSNSEVGDSDQSMTSDNDHGSDLTDDIDVTLESLNRYHEEILEALQASGIAYGLTGMHSDLGSETDLRNTGRSSASGGGGSRSRSGSRHQSPGHTSSGGGRDGGASSSSSSSKKGGTASSTHEVSHHLHHHSATLPRHPHHHSQQQQQQQATLVHPLADYSGG